MMNTDKHKYFLVCAAVFLFSLLPRMMLALAPPRLLVYEPVELNVLNSVLGLFAGNVSAGTTLWSTGILGLPLILAFFLNFVLKNIGQIPAFIQDPSVFICGVSEYIAGLILEPHPALTAGRCAVAFISSMPALLFFLFFIRRRLPYAAVISSVIFATSPFLIQEGASLISDSLALTFFAASLLLLLSLEGEGGLARLFWAGIFYGLSVAAKFPYLIFLPWELFAIAFLCRPMAARPLMRSMGRFFSGLALTVFVLIPYIWTNPLALWKNVLGNLAMYYTSQTAQAEPYYWKYLFRDAGLFLSWKGWLVLAIFGAVASFLRLGKRRAMILLAGLIVLILPLGFSHRIYPRYAMPLFIFVGIYVALFVELFAYGKLGRYKKCVCVATAAVIAAINLTAFVNYFRATHSDNNLSDCIAWVQKNIKPDIRLAVPANLSIYFKPNSRTLNRWLEAYGDMRTRVEERVDVYLSLNNLDLGINKGNPFIESVFGAPEKQRVFQWKLLLWYYGLAQKTPAARYDLFLYEPQPSDALSISMHQAVEMFIGGSLEALISIDSAVFKWVAPVKSFDKHKGFPCYLYCNSYVKEGD